ncbi:hypothetical protein DES49_0663 [Halospina denitrificans]|uniref:Uncharacterized protein n=1 Tax=Halospina denitrificans TaxID=332522 RepID=A0A4R7K140_9GAMM|nr:hypothetical protein [Halospina denitrificans]TDT44552.1 hypothetical protein DES49_0663 [Halospina denitrificans]
MSVQYGFQRLVLLGSAGYQRAELPLDDSVSLVAPNNAGKTSLINALQFLLIIDRRRMDFGAHEWDKTRRFYFPDNSAYILLEVSLPESGTMVLGCVGKGLGHEYEYFVYAGSLNVDDFRLADGTLVTQPQLKSHLGEQGRLVHAYNASEFADLLYGGRRSGGGSAPDFRVFRLENARDAGVYQKVLTRTLRLDKLTSIEVKDYLLRIFHRSLPDASINFKDEWEKAFDGVNKDRAQYKAAKDQVTEIDHLERQHEERLTLRGKVVAWKPLIDETLKHWQTHYEQQQEVLTNRRSELQTEQTRLSSRHQQLSEQRVDHKRQLEELTQQAERQSKLENHFALVRERGELEQRYEESRKAYEKQVTLVNNASDRKPDAIERELADNRRQQQEAQRQLENRHDNLYQSLAESLSSEYLARLNRGLNNQVMTLPSDQFQLNVPALKAWLSEGGEDRLALPGLSLSLHDLEVQFSQRSEAELRDRLSELEQQAGKLSDQLEAAREMEAARQRRDSHEKALKEVEKDLEAYDEMVALQQGAAERDTTLKSLQEQKQAIEEELNRFSERFNELNRQINQADQDLGELTNQHERINRLRGQRLDHREPFLSLAQMPHHAWMADTEVSVDELAVTLEEYQRDCGQVLELDRAIHQQLSALHEGGLTKYQYSGSEEEEVTRIIEFRHQLEREAEALERKARSAVVTVTSSLRQLRDGLLNFEKGMAEFKRLIGRRKLSDLETFRISPQRQEHLVGAINTLVDKAETVSSGESFEIFSQGSVLDDDQLDRARRTLIEEGDARSGLRVGDLFQLQFVVAKKGAPPESFDDIDSAASNGTVLMAKLVTGLAMLYLMQDRRHSVRAVCYLDEALALDADNQRSLIEAASEFGFSLIFASPAPLTTARYCVPIQEHNGLNHISRKSWQILESLEETPS